MKKTNKGFTLVELLVVIGILGLLMSVLVPQITEAMFKSNLQAMAMNGGKLVKAIVAENTSRMGAKPELWPHRTEADGLNTDDPDDITGQTFGTSTEYFMKLFDIENQTGNNWNPYIDREIVNTLWGFGVPPARPGNLGQNNVAWVIAAGMPEGTEGTIPVLVSRNLDTANFAKSGSTDMSNQKDVPDMVKYPQPFGKKGCVVVYKSGAARGLQSRDARLCDIYRDQPTITFTDGIQLEYLVP